MLDLYLMQFSKRENSTLIPTETQLASATRVSVALKGGCDILTPTFILESSNIPAGNNYAKFQERYYFITGISSVRNNLVEITARVDVLGSWKSAIQAMSAFVAYDTTANTEIDDDRLSVLTTPTIDSDSSDIEYLTRQGSLRLCVTNSNSPEVYVIETGSDLYDLMTDLPQYLSDIVSHILTVEDGIGAIIENFASMGTIANSIKSLYLVPWTTFGLSSRDVWIGRYNTGKRADCILAGSMVDVCRLATASVRIPWQFSDWRNKEPYTHVYLYIPFIGVIHLPASELIGTDHLEMDFSINQINGDFSVAVYAGAYGNSPCVYNGCGSSGISIPIGTSTINPAAVLNTMVAGGQLLVSAASKNPAVMLSALGNLAGHGLAALTPIMSSIPGGGGGSALELDFDIRCWTVCHNTNIEPSSVSAIMGTPTMKTKSLSGLTGYVQTVGASVSGLMLDTERTQINQLLDRGIYIE